MTSKEFVIWLKGFTEGVHEYNVSPKQWDHMKEVLEKVDDSFPLGGIISDQNTFKTHPENPMWQQPHRVNPFYVGDPVFSPLGSSGTGKVSGVITTTPGTGISSISVGTGVTTSTTLGYPSGSSWSYTTK
jgi:hypothetical protein